MIGFAFDSTVLATTESSMEKETIIRLKPKSVQGWPCPRCGGFGHNSDGMGSAGYDSSTGELVFTSRPCSKCYLCNGKGRVLVSQIPD